MGRYLVKHRDNFAFNFLCAFTCINLTKWLVIHLSREQQESGKQAFPRLIGPFADVMWLPV